MKYVNLFFIALIFTGCFRNKVKITGTVTGIPNATLSLKDGSGQTLEAVNAKDGKFELESSGWSEPDYGTLMLSQPGQSGIDAELYFEPGTYNVKYDYGNLDSYPQVTSNSAIQNQLSAFHQLFERMSIDAKRKVTALDIKYKQALKAPKLWDDSLSTLAERTEAERAKLDDVGRLALDSFLAKHPNSPIGLHIFQTLIYDSDPAAYNTLFKKLSPGQQNSEEGKSISTRLNALIHLVPGQTAPQIAGVMPDGKHLDLKALHKQVILIEFWRAGSIQSRLNHQAMLKNPWPAFTNNQMGIVSISFDRKRDWWLGSSRDDKLTWPQVSDLKGNDSPNADNWAIATLPAYFLLDGQGRVIERDLDFKEIPLAVDKYLKTAKL